MNNDNWFEGKSAEATILISDISYFTKITESKHPIKIISLLNEFYLMSKKIVNYYNGVITNFIGDGALVIFGVPYYLTNTHSVDAVLTGLKMLEEIKELNKQWSSEGFSELELRIGINTGQIVYGCTDYNLGEQVKIIITGNVPRLASRLNKLNKKLNTKILISETTLKRIKDFVIFQEHKNIIIPDIPNVNSVFEVIGVQRNIANGLIK